jgi:hypothetical protein
MTGTASKAPGSLAATGEGVVDCSFTARTSGPYCGSHRTVRAQGTSTTAGPADSRIGYGSPRAPGRRSFPRSAFGVAGASVLQPAHQLTSVRGRQGDERLAGRGRRGSRRGEILRWLHTTSCIRPFGSTMTVRTTTMRWPTSVTVRGSRVPPRAGAGGDARSGCARIRGGETSSCFIDGAAEDTDRARSSARRGSRVAWNWRETKFVPIWRR